MSGLLPKVENDDAFFRLPLQIEESAEAELVAADIAEENDSEVGRALLAVLVLEVNIVDVRESSVSELRSTTYDVTIWGGSGCKGGMGGIGKRITGPIVTCLKYVVK